MLQRLFSLAFLGLMLLAPTAASAQLSGQWRCVMNSAPATVEVDVAFSPDGSLQFRGTHILNGTRAINGIEGYGRYIIGRDHQGTLIRMQFHPGNVAIFSLFVRPTAAPDVLRNIFHVPNSGGRIVETACGRFRR